MRKPVVQADAAYRNVEHHSLFGGEKKGNQQKKHMRSKKNPKYLNVKLESCHFLSNHFNFSHLMPIQSIIQAVSFCLLLHSYQFK